MLRSQLTPARARASRLALALWTTAALALTASAVSAQPKPATTTQPRTSWSVRVVQSGAARPITARGATLKAAPFAVVIDPKGALRSCEPLMMLFDGAQDPLRSVTRELITFDGMHVAQPPHEALITDTPKFYDDATDSEDGFMKTVYTVEQRAAFRRWWSARGAPPVALIAPLQRSNFQPQRDGSYAFVIDVIDGAPIAKRAGRAMTLIAMMGCRDLSQPIGVWSLDWITVPLRLAK